MYDDTVQLCLFVLKHDKDFEYEYVDEAAPKLMKHWFLSFLCDLQNGMWHKNLTLEQLFVCVYVPVQENSEM